MYFIQAEDGGPVKIGTALDPLARLRALQTAHPAKLVIREILEGDLLGEAALHREFAPYHLRGEWFEPSWEIASWAAIKVGRHEPERPADLDAKLRAASKRIASRDRYELEDRQHFRKTAAERDRRIAADKRKQREREVTGPCGPLEIRFMTEGAE